MRAILSLHISSVLNRFPEVAWDRWAGDEDRLVVFGWIDREDGFKDFMTVRFDDGDLVTFTTSSARYSKEFSARLGATNHVDCKRVEDYFWGVRTFRNRQRVNR
jgi:hypothetical protein